MKEHGQPTTTTNTQSATPTEQKGLVAPIAPPLLTTPLPSTGAGDERPARGSWPRKRHHRCLGLCRLSQSRRQGSRIGNRATVLAFFLRSSCQSTAERVRQARGLATNCGSIFRRS